MVAETSLRQRKKAATRQAIVSSARQLFEQRGYDQVTVAEIADAANISVKTLFVYFRSKEDLVFADTSMIDSLVEAILHQPATASPASAVRQVLSPLITANDGAELNVEGFHRGIGQSGELRSPLLRMWANYEDQVATALATRVGLNAPTPTMRLTAIQLIGVIRTFTSDEIRSFLAGRDLHEQSELLAGWLDGAIEQIDAGLS